jgi:hypothetical protein
MELNAVNCGTSEIREYAVNIYNCQINQPSQTLPSAITKQHHSNCPYTYTKLKTETKFWSDRLATEEEETVT